VNVADLLAIVSVWGTNDPTGDVTGDGFVDVADILAVMADWNCN
jgi:hypothetical protein